MDDKVFLVSMLLLLVGVTVLSLWASCRLGSHGGAVAHRPHTDARPARKMAGGKDADLIAILDKVP